MTLTGTMEYTLNECLHYVVLEVGQAGQALVIRWRSSDTRKWRHARMDRGYVPASKTM